VVLVVAAQKFYQRYHLVLVKVLTDKARMGSKIQARCMLSEKTASIGRQDTVGLL
jgi:hypothetical protein